MSNNNRDLVKDGSEVERTLTVLGALKAYKAEDDELLDVYLSTFSESYLEFGVVSLAAGLLLSSPDYNDVLAGIEADHVRGTPDELRLLHAVRRIVDGEEHLVTKTLKPMSKTRWFTLLKITLTIIEEAVIQEEKDLDSVLNFIQSEFIRRSA